MPKVVITYDKDFGFTSVAELKGTAEYLDSEYQVVMDMKASHFRNIQRNHKRFMNDQRALMNFFIEAQMAGREIRER